jgi:hypothetical protein
VIVGVLSFLHAAPSAEPKPSAKIIEYGRYSGGTVTGAKKTKDKTSGGVLLDSDRKYKHIEKSKTIPMTVGESFGFRVQWANLPKGRAYEVKAEMLHPPIKQPNGEVLTKSEHKVIAKPREVPEGIFLWHFLSDYEYELVPGKWTNKVFIDGVEVASMTFDLVKN